MNDTSNVTVVTYDEETMTLARGLPWTSYNPCDLNDPNVEACVLPVYGTWLFFMREEQ
ncbi:MAG: hypothetical protein R8G66_08955 [Cytophagales bacterium]|nr:hypothetical protein [Cytophagales bacterium]